MMEMNLLNLTLLVLSLSSLLSFGGCAPKRHNASPITSLNGEAKNGDSDLVKTEIGTSDSGGGTGVDGKVFESYQIDYFELEAFTEVIVPIFKSLSGSSVDIHTPLLLTGKTWYIAPLKLESVSKDSLGLSFVGSGTDQLARQSQAEIWIDKTKFDKMNLQDQATLILHELVMANYMSRFKKMSELCAEYLTFETLPPEETLPEVEILDCHDSSFEIFDTTYPPLESPRALNEVDNERIRRVTTWILAAKNRNLKIEDLYKVALANGFDERSWSDLSDGKTEKSLHISPEELLLAFDKLSATITQYSRCYSSFDEKWTNCQFEATNAEPESDLLGEKSKWLNLQFSENGSSRSLTSGINTMSGEEIVLANIRNGIYFTVIPKITGPKTIPERFENVIVFFSRDENKEIGYLSIEHMAFVPGIFYHNEISEYGLSQCLTTSIAQPQNREESAVLITRKNKSEISSAVKQVVANLRVTPVCERN